MSESLKQITDLVWYLPASPLPEKVQPNVGVIIGADETVLIDAGNTPLVAHQIVIELARLEAPPISKVIYTHHHWDHVFGACVYGVEVVAHTSCKQLLEEEANKPWGLQYLVSEVERDSSLKSIADVLSVGVEDWKAFN